MKPAQFILIAIILAASSANAAFEIDTSSNWNGDIVWGGVIGEGHLVSTYGQTFSTPLDNHLLDSFSIWLDPYDRDREPFQFAGYLMEWNGQRATGPMLYQDLDRSTGGQVTQWQAYEFSIGVTLEPQTNYIFFISASNYNGTPNGAYVGAPGMGSIADAYSDGAIRYLKEPLNLSQISETEWGMDGYVGRDDLVFRAQFSPHVVHLPLPASVWLLGCGIVAFAGIRRIRIKKFHK